MTTEDEIRRVLHPEAHEPMRYEPRIPLGCDQQGSSMRRGIWRCAECTRKEKQ